MKTSLLLLVGALLVGTTSFAQFNSTVGTVNAAAYSAANVNSAVSNTGSAVKSTANTVKDIGSLFKKKEKSVEIGKEAVVATNVIIITITGIDYTRLKLTEDNIKPIEGVKSTIKKFSTSGSIIEVTYTGKDDQLWDALPETIKELFNLTDLGNGKIILEQKK